MPQMRPPRANRAQRDRLAHIERLLWWRGWVRRKDLVAVFGISELQASHDLREYRAHNPTAMLYDQKSARYVATALLKRTDDAAANLEEAACVLTAAPRAANAGPTVGRVALPARHIEPIVAQSVVRAILAKQALRIRYASIHSNTFRWRWITPHALGNDGWRWHVRAYCADDRDFRDFVLGRIAETGECGPPAAKAEDDLDWTRESAMQVKPHPALGAAQRRALALDFTMHGGAVVLRGAPALLHYALAALGLTREGQPLPVRFAITGQTGTR
jgi:hypothetical protein